MCSPLKTVLGKSEIDTKHNAVHIKHTLQLPAHTGIQCPVDSDIDLYIEKVEGINTGPDNDN